MAFSAVRFLLETLWRECPNSSGRHWENIFEHANQESIADQCPPRSVPFRASPQSIHHDHDRRCTAEGGPPSENPSSLIFCCWVWCCCCCCCWWAEWWWRTNPSLIVSCSFDAWWPEWVCWCVDTQRLDGSCSCVASFVAVKRGTAVRSARPSP